MFNQGIPTGIEIRTDPELKNMVLIPIPKTNFHLMGIRRSNGKWNITIMDRMLCCKSKIANEAEEKDFMFLIQKVLSNPEQMEFKTLTFKVLRNHYKSLIMQFKSSKIRFDRKITL